MKEAIRKQGIMLGKSLGEESPCVNWLKATRAVADDLLAAVDLDHVTTSYVAVRQGRKKRSVISLEDIFQLVLPLDLDRGAVAAETSGTTAPSCFRIEPHVARATRVTYPKW